MGPKMCRAIGTSLYICAVFAFFFSNSKLTVIPVALLIGSGFERKFAELAMIVNINERMENKIAKYSSDMAISEIIDVEWNKLMFGLIIFFIS